MKLRDGSLSMLQVLARIREQQSGKTIVCLEDLKDDLHPSFLVKPSKYI